MCGYASARDGARGAIWARAKASLSGAFWTDLAPERTGRQRQAQGRGNTGGRGVSATARIVSIDLRFHISSASGVRFARRSRVILSTMGFFFGSTGPSITRVCETTKSKSVRLRGRPSFA